MSASSSLNISTKGCFSVFSWEVIIQNTIVRKSKIVKVPNLGEIGRQVRERTDILCDLLSSEAISTSIGRWVLPVMAIKV